MSNAIKGFCLFYDWVDVLSDLDPADAMEVIRAISAYKQTGADPVEAVPKSARPVMRMMFQQIQRGEQVSAVRSNAGKASAESRFADFCSTSVQQKGAAVQQKSTTETETNTETENIKKEPLSKERGKKESAPRFLPPTLKEVEEYCKSRNSSVDPKAFWEYFNEGGWKDSKGQPVQNWKQKLLTWEKYDAPTKQTKKTEPKESSFDTDDFFEVSLKRSYENEAARTDTSDAALLSALKASVGVTA